METKRQEWSLPFNIIPDFDGEVQVAKEIFCNWDVASNNFACCDFLKLPNLEDYDFFFFDPINFALSHEFRENREDLWAKEYIQISERKYHLYLQQIKKSIDGLREFFDAGGIMIIRSAFPNSYINVRKRSSTSMGKYTKTITSPFFWLEEFIGKYSFDYSPENKIKFLDKKSMLFEFFKNTAIVCPQTQNSISRGNVEVIAVNNEKTAFPIISRVALHKSKGEIYFIPKFLINDEPEKLVEVFNAIKQGRKSTEYRPQWVNEYEDNLIQSSPYIHTIEGISRKIEELERQRKSLRQKDEDIKVFVDLLYKSGNELSEVVRKAFRLLGFFFPEIPAAISRAGFDFYMRDKDAFQIVGQISTTLNGPVELGALEQFESKVKTASKSGKPICILVANAEITNSPRRRREWFSQELINKNRALDYCLISTKELFDIVSYLINRSQSEIKDEVSRSLRRDILKCTEVFHLNRKKFLSMA